MKKRISIIVLCMLCLVANAQVFQYGIKAGMNLSGESEHEYPAYTFEGSGYTAGFALGGVFNYQLSHTFDLEADLMYSMQGMKDDLTIMNDNGVFEQTVDYKIRSHYMNLPIVLKYFVMDGLYIECGPQVGYLLSKKDEAENIDMTNSFDSSNTKKADFSILGGLGIVFKNNMFIDARYIHGMTDTSRLYKGGRNRTFQIVLGYYFN